MADIKSREVLLAELKTFMRAVNPSMDSSGNSLTKDIVLNPYSIGGGAIMSQVQVVKFLHILSYLEGGDVDNEGTNYNKERLTGDFAVVVLTFYTVNRPTADIVVPASTQAQTTGTSFVSPSTYSTVAEARFSLGDVESYYSFDRARYEFNVLALSDDVGTVGNVGARMITSLIGSVSGIEGVTNLTASVGGLDEESDDDYKERIRLAKTGRDLNVVNGIKGFVKDAGFLDAYPVRVEDTDSERATGVDVFVISSNASVYTEIFTYDPAKERYYLAMRPVTEITSVVGSNKGTLGLSDYDANIDNSSELRRSIYATDHVRIRTAAALLPGEQITVTYNYDASIQQTQETFDLNDNNILTADPLIKRAYPLYLSIVGSLTLKANADGATTRNKVKNALSQFLSTYRLGDDIQKSDLIVVMQEGYGDFPVDTVDAVIITSYILTDEDGAVRQPTNEVIAVGNKEYAVYGAATLT
jgi:hypothetical protein